MHVVRLPARRRNCPGSHSCYQAVAPGLLVVTDLCFCEYTDHGHCGPLAEIGGRIDVDNDATLPLLAEQAKSHAKAGADVIAPSGMMDGMVQAIRHGLDTAGFTDLPIISYAAKYASGYYGPFREAAESAPSFGDRRSYQMDPANTDEAIREVALDLAEGADVVMVKPALAYLDIICASRKPLAFPWRHTMFQANTPWSRPRPPMAGSTSAELCSKRSRVSAAPAPI